MITIVDSCSDFAALVPFPPSAAHSLSLILLCINYLVFICAPILLPALITRACCALHYLEINLSSDFAALVTLCVKKISGLLSGFAALVPFPPFDAVNCLSLILLIRAPILLRS